jgi:hypothetical protein
MAFKPNRREFIKTSLLTSAAAGVPIYGEKLAYAAETAAAPAPGPAAALPQGKIGELPVSRVLLGGNLLTHFTHSRDLKYVYKLCEHYNTDEKILATLALAEQHGVNTLVVHTVPRILETLKKYRYEMGGKIQWIICPTAPVEGDLSEYAKQVQEIADNGVDAVYLWGVTADRLVAEGKGALIKKAIDVAKEHNLPSGVGAHDLKVIEECEERQSGADFYIKTFHHHNYPTGPKPEELAGPHSEIPGYWCRDPQATVDLMSKVEKPWMAFKVMAAGAIPPPDAFQYAFDSGADHILVGMFDFEIEEDIRIVNEVLAKVNRTRPWRS